MTVGVLGGGQLGMMLGEAAKRLGMRCVFLDPNAQSPAAREGELLCAAYDDREALGKLASMCDVITYEFENVPVASAQSLAETKPVYPSPDILAAAQDRLAEKNLLASIGIDVAPYMSVESEANLKRALRELGAPAVLKTRRMGYDGKGQCVINSDAELSRAWNELGAMGALILEGYVPFDRELSVIAARGRDGSIVAYPLTENKHEGGILRVSRAPAIATPAMLERAQRYVTSLLAHASYVGTVTIELFESGGELLANEIAPRVHNSGHWTIEGASVSQFENHLRAITGMPLGHTEPKGWSAMINVIGDPTLLNTTRSSGNVFVHDYGKEPREGRKLGHITVNAETQEEREEIVGKIMG